MSHYFTNDESLKHQETSYKVSLFSHQFEFVTDKGVFSLNGLDYGSKVLIEQVKITTEKRLLDVGCGVGPIGIILKKVHPNLEVFGSDVNHRALDLAKRNSVKNKVEINIIESNLFEAIDGQFDIIISNPPIRAGKKVIYKLYEDAHTHLNDGGYLWIVVRKQQGAPSTLDFLKTIYKEVSVVTKDKGYYVICGQK